MRRRQFFGNAEANPDPNTFIGGVGATSVTSASDLAGLTTLSVGDIQDFSIDGSNNVSCYIETPYSFNNNAFLSDSSITWYLDIEGYVTSLGAKDLFDAASNLLYFYFPSATSSGFNGAQGSFNVNSLIKANFISVINPSGREFLTNSDLTTLNLNAVTTIEMLNTGYNILRNNTFLLRLNLKNCTTLKPSASVAEYFIAERFFGGINTSCKIYINASLGSANRSAYVNAVFDAAATVGDSFTLNGLVYTAVSGTPTADGEFDVTTGNQNAKTTSIENAVNSDTRTGTLGKCYAQSETTNLAFYTDVLGVSGESVSISNTSGTPLITIDNPTLQYGVRSLYPYHKQELNGVTLIECGSPITVNPPSSLSYSSLTANTVDLDFTEPTANANGTECFEVWVDDGTVYRKLFEYDEISASGDTVDLTEIVNDGNSSGISGSKIKIRTIDGEMNFSAFSNEITLP